MNDDAANNGASVWSTDQIYYWPGADHSFQFYAWAPTDADGLTTPSTPKAQELLHIQFQQMLAEQKDIVVATTT
jgi:hypothetical protein